MGAAGLALGSGLGSRQAQAKDLVLGFIYVGPKDDYGYNQAHAEAAAVLKKTAGVKVVEEEKVTCPNCGGTGRDTLKRIADIRQVKVEELTDENLTVGDRREDGKFRCFRCAGVGHTIEKAEFEI